MKNSLKAESFTYSFARINEAIAMEFYLEAITLAESIISDRLLSFVSYHEGAGSEKSPFNILIKSAKKFKRIECKTKKGIDLFVALDMWRIQRNICIHSAAKSKPGQSTLSVQDYCELARVCAIQGKSLARTVCDWHRSEKKIS